MAKCPWDYQPDLKPGYLQLVAKVLRDTRNTCLIEHNTAAGDTPWVFGTKVYGRSCEMLMRASEAMWTDWFRVVKPPLEFVFAIGSVPVRYYSGDPRDPGGRHTKLCAPEMYQLDLLHRSDTPDLIWRIVVDPEISGDTARVVLVGMTDDGTIECFYEIPDDGVVVLFQSPDPSKESGPGVTLPPAAATLRTDRKTKKDDDSDSI